MRALIVYDSEFGNTEQVARAIGKALGEETSVVRLGSVAPDELSEYELVIVGSPTQAGKPTTRMKEFFDRIPGDGLKGVNVAGFDTRVDSADQGFPLKALMAVIGYAAPRIAKTLEAKGGRRVTQPQGFIVEGKEGPLREGEIERAAAWASTLVRVRARSNLSRG